MNGSDARSLQRAAYAEPAEAPTPSGMGGSLRIALSRVWLVALAVVVCAAGARHVSQGHQKSFQASGQVRLETSKGISDDLLGTGAPASSTHAAAELAVLKGPDVAASVASRLSLSFPPRATFTPQSDPNLVAVAATARSPKLSADIVNAYGNAYVDVKRTQDASLVASATKYLQSVLANLQAQIAPLQNQVLHPLPLPTVGTPTAAQASAKAANDLAVTQLASLTTQQLSYQNRLNQLQFDAALGKRSDAALLSPAQVPTSPSSPRPARDTALGAALGLLLGIGLAVSFEAVDDRVKSRQDVESSGRGLPVLATLPGAGGALGRRLGHARRVRRKGALVTVAAPRSVAAEAYRDLRTTIRFLAHERAIRAIQVTRPTPRGDHTTVLANLAVSSARADQSTTIVCCDLRRPELHTLFGVANEAGLTTVILGDATLAEVSQPVTGEPGLLLVPAGPLPPNPSELLSGVRTDEIFDDLFKGSELLLVDSPPVLPITDAAVLSQRVDATIVVVSAGSTTKRELAEAVDALARVNAPVAGIVLLSGRSRRSRRSPYSSIASGPGEGPASQRPFTRAIATEHPSIGNGRSVGSGETVTPGGRRSS